MKYTFGLTFLIFILLLSCKESVEETPLQEQIEALELQFNEKPSSELATSLLEKYATYTNQNPNDDRTNSKILRKTARIYETADEVVTAASTLVLALKRYYGKMETEANIATLIRYYEKLGNQAAANTTKNGYLMAFPNGSKAENYIQELGDQRKPLNEQLDTLAIQIVQPKPGEQGLNVEAVNQYIGVSEIYALTNNKKDTLSTDYLFKAGKLAMTIGNQEKALECYHWIYTAFPNSKEAPSAKFTHAFTLDNQLGRIDEARVLYEEFLKKYPDHHFADDTKFQLSNLGKKDSEILEDLKKRASQGQ